MSESRTVAYTDVDGSGGPKTNQCKNSGRAVFHLERTESVGSDFVLPKCRGVKSEFTYGGVIRD